MAKKIFMLSLGCAKNLVDSEIILGETLGGGFDLALDPAEADIIVINTCGFIQDARDESRAVIEEFLALKRQIRRKIKVVAAGCWSEREPEAIAREFPELDAVWGLKTPTALGEALRRLSAGGGVFGIGKPRAPLEGARLLSTAPSFAYLKISDGCDNNCAYCAIPGIRGRLRSRASRSIVEEARILEDQGVKELVVIGQDTTAYGHDFGKKGPGLAALLDELLRAVKVPRVRLLYAHPAHIDEDVVALLLSEDRLCRYVDLPVQHVSDAVLAAMGRGYGKERVLELLERFNTGRLTLRTTFLAGFPGESENDFAEALETVRQGRFQHMGAFAYSPEKGTRAESLGRSVAPEEAARRRDELMKAQSLAAFAWLESRVGKTEELLVEGRADDGRLRTRSRHEAPDADGTVFIKSGKARPGDMIVACIKAREGYDLVASVSGPSSRKGEGGGRRMPSTHGG